MAKITAADRRYMEEKLTEEGHIVIEIELINMIIAQLEDMGLFHNGAISQADLKEGLAKILTPKGEQ